MKIFTNVIYKRNQNLGACVKECFVMILGCFGQRVSLFYSASETFNKTTFNNHTHHFALLV
jgi:hypothetical protein